MVYGNGRPFAGIHLSKVVLIQNYVSAVFYKEEMNYKYIQRHTKVLGAKF